MKAIKDCEWVVKISPFEGENHEYTYYWVADTKSESPPIRTLIGYDNCLSMGLARENFIEFARIHEIINYRLIPQKSEY